MRDDSASIYKGKLPESIFFILIFAVLWSAMWCVCLCVRTWMCVCLSLWLICVSVCACGLSVCCSSSSSYLVPFASRLAYLFAFLMLLSFIATRQKCCQPPKPPTCPTQIHIHTRNNGRRQSVNSLWKWSRNFSISYESALQSGIWLNMLDMYNSYPRSWK